MIFLGILILIVSLTLMVNQRYKFLPQLVMRGSLSKIVNITAFVSVLLIFFNQLFIFTDAGTTYTLQHKFVDKQYTISGESGLKVKGFAKVTEVDAELVVKTLTPKQYVDYKKGNRKESRETYIIPANQVSFNDKIGVWLNTTTIIDCSPDSDGFTNVVIKGKSESNIVYQRIIPLINEVQGNLVKLFGTEDYIEGAKVIASQMFYDQLQNGKYKVVEDPDYKAVTTGVIDSVLTTTSSKKMTERYVIDTHPEGTFKTISGVKVDISGEKIRTSLGLGAYGFQVRSGQIESEEYHQDFEDQLDAIRTIQAASQKLKQDTEKQIRQQEFNEAEAEANRIAEEGVQKVNQTNKVIAAQTRAEEAKYYEQEQNRLLEGEKKATMVAKEKANQIAVLRNSGGIDPKEELQMRLDNEVEIASAIFGPEGLVLPVNYLSGGGDSNNDVLQAILSMHLLNKPDSQ